MTVQLNKDRQLNISVGLIELDSEQWSKQYVYPNSRKYIYRNTQLSDMPKGISLYDIMVAILSSVVARPKFCTATARQTSCAREFLVTSSLLFTNEVLSAILRSISYHEKQG